MIKKRVDSTNLFTTAFPNENVTFLHPSREREKLLIPERISIKHFTVIISGYENNFLLANKLRSIGYEVLLIPARDKNEEMYIKNILKGTGKLPLHWMRDSFFETSNSLYILPNRSKTFIDFFSTHSVPFRKEHLIESQLAEQGNVVSDGDILLIHQELLTNKDVITLRNSYHVFGIPMPSRSDIESKRIQPSAEKLLDKNLRDYNEHIDKYVAVFVNSLGKVLLVATSLYYSVYPQFMNDLSKRLNAQLYIHNGNHVNFPILPDGTVLIEKNEKSFTPVLRKFMGRSQVLEVFYHDDNQSGRLRCRINTLRKS